MSLSRPGGVRQKSRQVAVARAVHLEGEAEAFGPGAGLGLQRRVVGLGQVDDLFVVAEHHRQQIGVAVAAHDRIVRASISDGGRTTQLRWDITSGIDNLTEPDKQCSVFLSSIVNELPPPKNRTVT